MRVEGWEQILEGHIRTPPDFEWGMNDCALWCADWVKKATGVDCASEWRGKYATEAELRQIMDERGIRNISGIATGTGFPEMHVAFAQRGDIVLHPQGCLGICAGVWSRFLIEKGVTNLKTGDCVTAWKVR